MTHRCALAAFVASALAALAALAAIAALGGCTADTEDLRGRHDAGLAPDGGDAGRDATIGQDAHDSGIECTQVSECTNLGAPPCEDPSNCRCGCYGFCSEGRCTVFCDDSPDCHPSLDAGIPPDSGIPPEPQECTTEATCPSGQLPRVCNNQGGPSCAFNACVSDCAGPRTCGFAGDCVDCTYTTTTAVSHGCPTCIMLPLDEATVEDATCELGLDPDDVIRFTSQQDCSWSVDFAGTGSASDRLVSLDDGQFVGTLSRFGAPCLVSFATTNALRTIWACPGCTFVLFHR